MTTTTLQQIRDLHPCREGWEMLLRHLRKTKADDEPLPLTTILKSNGLADALWCLRTLGSEYQHLLVDFAYDCAQATLARYKAHGDILQYVLSTTSQCKSLASLRYQQDATRTALHYARRVRDKRPTAATIWALETKIRTLAQNETMYVADAALWITKTLTQKERRRLFVAHFCK